MQWHTLVSFKHPQTQFNDALQWHILLYLRHVQTWMLQASSILILSVSSATILLETEPALLITSENLTIAINQSCKMSHIWQIYLCKRNWKFGVKIGRDRTGAAHHLLEPGHCHHHTAHNLQSQLTELALSFTLHRRHLVEVKGHIFDLA